MSRQIIDIGIQGNDGTGDSIRESFRKVNDNFQQLFSLFGDGDRIGLVDLDDTPDVFFPSDVDRASILVADDTGSNFLSKVLIGGDGIVVDNSNPEQITIFGGGGELIGDDNPTLGANLNASGFGIGNLANPEDVVDAFNITFNNGLSIATADDFAISRGYADRRYLQANSGRAGTTGNQVRVRFEPADTSEYTITLGEWEGGFMVIENHGFNTSINGSGFVYDYTGTTPAFPLIRGNTYYIRYVDNRRLAVYDDRDQAINDNSLANYIPVNIDPIISPALRGIETITDEYYDPTLEGNWVSNEALPRISVVRRQGDRMDGTLYLQDHPGSLAGIGTPNGIDDLQAATKLYVDQSSFASIANLFVATSGDDIQANTPPGKEGRSLSYAFATLNKACEKAEELINESLTEPGPYRQLVTYDAGLRNSVVTDNGSTSPISANRRLLKIFTNGQGVDQSININNRDLREGSILKGINSGATAKVISYTPYSSGDGINDDYVIELLHKITDPNNFQSSYTVASSLINSNREFIVEQTILYINDNNPALDYNSDTCARDLRLILQALEQDIRFGGNKKTLEAAKAYWRGNVRALPTSQLADTVGAIDYARRIIQEVLDNDTLSPAINPPDFGFRIGGSLTQIVTSVDGEIGSRELVDRLFAVVLDILENGLEGSGELLEFQPGEIIEYGQLVPELQITIRVETGIYYEQLPIRIPPNVSIKGDEFRRVIIRPAFGESQSKWAPVYFYRDDTFDGMTRTYISTASAISSFVSGEHRITVSSTDGLEQGMYLKVISGTGSLRPNTRVREVLSSTTFSIDTPPFTALNNAVIRGLNSSGLAPTGENFAYHYLTDPSDPTSRPKENKDMDVFLLNDATILRNITCQSHGGFMCVLDPTGQIQTKSPYFQTCTSLSGSIGKQRFAGGMLVDGSAGNLPSNIISKTNNFVLTVGGLNVRLPQMPTSFYIEGRRYQVNEIEPLVSPGQARIFLDPSSNDGVGYNEAQFTTNPGVVSRNIIFETAGNRSMLANDYTQVNDLGYGCIATNNGISELVSVFTYYCWTSYYSVNGGQIRSTQGNSSYGQFGMRANGRDNTEVPDPVNLVDNTLQVARVYKTGAFASKNTQGEISVYIDHYQFVPYNVSEIEIDHSNTRSSLAINSPTFPNNVVITNPGLGYQVGQLLKPTTGVTFTTNSHTMIEVVTIGGGGTITSFRVVDAGDYSVAPITIKQAGVFAVDAHPLNTIPLGGANGATFTGTFIGERRVYEVNSIEQTEELGSGFDSLGNPITTLPVLKLNLQSNTNSALTSSLENGQHVIIRGLQNFKFNGIDEVRPVRPSTALEFTEPAEIGTVYRTLSYNLNGPVGETLGPDEAILTFDNSYDYVIIQTNPSRLADVDYVVGGIRRMGSTIGDTRIAVIPPDPSDQARINSGNMIMAWSGKLFRITSYTPASGPNSAYITLDDFDFGLGSNVNVAGLSEPLPRVEQIVLRAGIDAGSPAEITVRISTCRASGHDFLDVGTGGFVTSNYPNNLYGAPAIPKSQSNEVVEETQGRVFYVSTDQDGIFRVGKFFTVDQGTGTVTFSASIALSNLDGIGFKRGTVVKEFSTDDTMTDAASDTVPTEGAVVGYISKRLGITPQGAVVPENERIPVGSGFVSVTGAIPMTGSLNMGTPNNRIINLATPITSSDATTKGYVDNLVSQYDELSELTDVTLTSPTNNDVLRYNGTDWVNSLISNASVATNAAIAQSKLSLNSATTRANATGITQADLGLASFDSANFEITNGWVGIRNGGISYTEIQNVTAGRILGNLTGSATTIQEVTPSLITERAVDDLATTIDVGSTVLSVRRNRLRTAPSSTFTSITGVAVAGTSTVTNVPSTNITGSGSGARFNVTRSGGVYTTITVAYGGSGYAEGNRLIIDGSLLGGLSGINDVAFTITTTGSNIDTGTVFSLQRISVTAETNSIVATDLNRNLGNAGNRFNSIFSTNVSALGNIDSNNLYVEEFYRSGVDINVTATGPGQAGAYPISRSITVVTSIPASTGVRLPNGITQGGTRIIIRNNTLNNLEVYPNVGAEINTLGQNVPFEILSNSALEFISVSPTQWFTLTATLA